MARPTELSRPDPTALLQLAGGEGRGKLTIFLGAAPGVGKTYAMLARAQRLRAEGVDIVVGLVETHGRSETAQLLDGLETLPRRPGPHDGDAYGEFDLDAALVRKPRIIIVDELAHSNGAGSRHPKRYQDIAELIDAGIEVWTALNVQHLESLAELVTTLTGVPVRETVPDLVLQHAHEVLLVDLPPAELIARLNEGKVYLPGNAKRAADGFFKPANLTALRELALRRAADRVDDQMTDILRQQAVDGPWATAERLLVCVGPDQLSANVVRTAARLATGLNARWLVVSLGRASNATLNAERSARLETTLALAERLGAEIRRLTSDDYVAEIIRLARKEHITQIVIGRPKSGVLTRWSFRSLPNELLRSAGDIGVYLVPGEAEKSAPRNLLRPRSMPEWLTTIAVPVLSVAAIVGIGRGLTQVLALQNLSILFLLAVVISAMSSGLIGALLAAGLSFVAYNFFFIEPLFTLTVARPNEILSLLIFVAVAGATGTLAARLSQQMQHARQSMRNTQNLYDFSRRLSAAYGLDNVMIATASHLHAALNRSVVVLAPDDAQDLAIQAAWPPDIELDPTAMTAARWAWDKKEAAGFGTGTLPQVPLVFTPIRSGQRLVGVVGIAIDPAIGALSVDEDRQLTASLEQAAIAIDRARLVRDNARAAIAREGEKLQSALLSSLSHDLRTPLASITGAITTLRQLGDKIPAASRDDLLLSIEEETGRLNRFVGNLFDMTRLESGLIRLRRDPIDLGAVIAGAMARAKAVHPDIAIDLSLAAGLKPALGDAAMLEQVLFNLLDNARKYAGKDGPIAVYVRTGAGLASISITDQGKGIPQDELEAIFEKFYRRAKGDGRAAGTGLGLSIARGFVQAMGGTIKAESPAARKRGTRFTIRLPLAGEPIE
ncbi:sensor histidine kinase KdpD [Devosia sp.]|uniref:sensor histidine kinase KdpD n=1 Tax=Devosia sp. TaxID=1871048 RepID=UPI003267C0AC